MISSEHTDGANLALGLELSTQSAKWVVVNTGTGDLEGSGSIEYDTRFPQYGTRGGVLPSSDARERHSPPEMFLDALDAVFSHIVESGVAMERIAAVKCDAQQHCSVYLDDAFSPRLAELSSGRPLSEQLSACFTRERSPIWEDRTTEQEARELEQALEAAGGIRALTGNRAELRFPASQIIRWARQSPEDYQRTAHIQLLSAFLTSVLTGGVAAVDTGDGWGTNLNTIDIDNPGFSREAIAATAALIGNSGDLRSGADRLAAKLGQLCAYDEPLGRISAYFARRYGVNPQTMVLAGTGDNPATLLGCGDGALISLGTSYTVCGPVEHVAPSEDDSYNVFGYRPGYAMALTVITNGGKLHDQFCAWFAAGDWERYAELAGTAELSGNTEPLMLPYLSDESVPVAPAGIVRDGFSGGEARANVRALHLAQVASMRLHSRHLSDVSRLCIVGGGYRNALMRQALADAFQAETYTIDNADVAAPFGCAVSAARYALGIQYSEAANRFVRVAAEGRCRPFPERAAQYESLLYRYAELEQQRKTG